MTRCGTNVERECHSFLIREVSRLAKASMKNKFILLFFKENRTLQLALNEFTWVRVRHKGGRGGGAGLTTHRLTAYLSLAWTILGRVTICLSIFSRFLFDY